MPQQIDPKINWNEWEEVNPESYQAASAIVHIWEGLGRPSTPFTDSGQKMMDALIAAWEYKFPKEAVEWKKDRAEYQGAELSIGEQVRKGTGRTLACYPYFIYQMWKKLSPEFKIGDRKNAMEIARKWPMFRYANKI